MRAANKKALLEEETKKEESKKKDAAKKEFIKDRPGTILEIASDDSEGVDDA